MSQVWIIVFVKELSVSLTELKRMYQGAVKEKMDICFNIKAKQAKWIQSILKAMFKYVFT